MVVSSVVRRCAGICLTIVLIAMGVSTPALAPSAGASTGATGVRVSPNFKLGKDPLPARGRDVIGMSVDPNAPNHIVQTNFDYVRLRCEYRVSFDGGKTWRGGSLRGPSGFPDPPCYINNSQPGGRPSDGSVGFGAHRNVYTTFSAEHDGDRDSVIVLRSTDGGRTFKQRVAALPYSADVDYRRPKLTVVPGETASSDLVYITSWACSGRSFPLSSGSCNDVVFSASHDSGETFTSPVPINSFTRDLGFALDNSQITVASDGSIYVVYRIGAGSGTTLRLARSTDEGKTWEQSTVRSNFRPQRGFIDPKLVVDKNSDALYLAYEEATASTGSDIFVQRSTDAGATWASPVRVNDDQSAAHQIAPWVSVADDGRIDVTWFDQRNPYPGNSLEDVYYAHSTDAGETFSSNRRVTDRIGNRDVGYKPRLGVFAPVNTPIAGNKVLVAWADSREGSYLTAAQDIYLARIDLRARGPVPVQRIRSSEVVHTSVELSRVAYPGGSEIVGQRETTRVVVVNAEEPADALVAGVLARAQLGSVLLSGEGKLAPAVVREIKRLDPIGAYLIGNEGKLSEKVQQQIVETGVAADAIVRIAADDPAETARLVALSLDRRSDAQKLTGERAFSQVVIVNPASGSAIAAAGIAAQLRVPILFADFRAVPEATKQALEELNVDATLVIAGEKDIADATLAELPGPTRIGGADLYEVSRALTTHAIERGLPFNVVYTADPADGMAGAPSHIRGARRGGTFLLSRGSAHTRSMLGMVELDGRVDRIVQVSGS